MSKENGGPAFPCMPPQDMATGPAPGYPFPEAGMTLRDYFAVKAMQLAFGRPGTTATLEEFARNCYSVADAMLAERSKP